MKDRKYILTDEFKTRIDRTLHRIQAIRDFNDVKAGDLGGWVENEENLSHEGDCWVYEDAIVMEKAKILDNAVVHDFARVSGFAVVCKNARVDGHAAVGEDALVTDIGNVSGYAVIRKNAIVSVTGGVNGYANIATNGLIQSSADWLSIGPIGSRDAFVTFYKATKHDIYATTGCFTGSLCEFEKAIHEKHYGTQYFTEYMIAIGLAKYRIKELSQK